MMPWARRDMRSRRRRRRAVPRPSANAPGRGQSRGNPRRAALALSLAVAVTGALALARAAGTDDGDVVVALTGTNTVTVTVPDGARVPALTERASATAGGIAGVAAPAAPGRGAARAPTNVVLSVARPDSTLQCANWIYAGAKSSVCFSPKFLETVSRDTNIEVAPGFTPVKLAARSVFEYPFAVMTGEGSFSLQEEERRNLKEFLGRGGFLLASAGCSCKEWARSFQIEFRKVFPDRELKKIPMGHALFRTLFNVQAVHLKRGGTTQLEGLEMNGRVVLVYTSEGLNDTSNVEGCCCCGGNEIKNSHEINANIFAYSVMH